MISESGQLPLHIYQPPSVPCKYCSEACTGTIGDMLDRNKSYNSCYFCYEHVAQLRPLLFEWTDDYVFRQIKELKKLEQTPRVLLAIEKYKEKL
jgi:Fe-S-cluster-containing dehydrogenase component